MSPSLLVSLLLSAQGTQAPLLIRPSVAQLVVVDAYVTDQKGRPVTDLRKEDFELREDSRPVEITAFQGPEEANQGNGTATTAGAAGAPGAPSREPLTVAIYVDRALLSPPGRKRALDQAATLAERHIAQGARVVVVGDDSGLRPLTPLTTDPLIVREALTRMQGWATQSPGAVESRSVLENMKSRIDVAETTKECEVPACVCVLPDLIEMIRGYATFREIEVQAAAARLGFLVNALRALPGSKALIYVSEGIEQRPGVQLFDQLTTVCPEAQSKDASAITSAMQERDTSSLLREMAARANAARVTFYPLDARGLSGLSSGDIEMGDRRYIASARTDGVKDANLVNQYRLLAEETGGFAMIRGLDSTAAMKRFDADMKGHYVIGFTPGDADGRKHFLYVGPAKTSARRNLEIRYRQSYFRAELPARRGQRALSALLFGLEENSLNTRASVERMSAGLAKVRVSIPLAALKALEGLATPQGRVQIVISFRSAESEKGDVAVREKEFTFNLSPQDLEKDGGRRNIEVDVPVGPGQYEFVVGVEDVASGAESYLRLKVAS